ncbi:MAG: hypothetical protein ABI647_08320 [Gemmatimonadota bacterium]
MARELGVPQAPSKVFRFALGSAVTPLSLVWRVWTREDELHLEVRTADADVSFTAWPTGRWRIAVGEIVSRWNRPKEFRPGWTRGPDLVIPHSAVVVPSPALKAEPVMWLPPPRPGHLVRFSLLFASPRIEENRWRPTDAPGIESVTVLPLRRAGTVHICRGEELLGTGEGADPPSGEPGPGDGSAASRVIVSADRTGRPSLWESRTQ